MQTRGSWFCYAVVWFVLGAMAMGLALVCDGHWRWEVPAESVALADDPWSQQCRRGGTVVRVEPQEDLHIWRVDFGGSICPTMWDTRVNGPVVIGQRYMAFQVQGPAGRRCRFIPVAPSYKLTAQEGTDAQGR